MKANAIKAISNASFLVLMLTGCASILPQATVERQAFSWVEPGRTTRSDAVFSLGMPRSVFEHDTVFVYGVNCPSRARCRTVPWRGIDGGDLHYQLVLTFDATGLLQQRVLLREWYLPGTMTPNLYVAP
jgi:hypothetical protein